MEEKKRNLGTKDNNLRSILLSNGISADMAEQILTQYDEKSVDNYEVPQSTAMIAVMTDNHTLSYYIDGYKNVSISKEEIPSQTIVSGNVNELEMLVGALGRNRIKTMKIKEWD